MSSTVLTPTRLPAARAHSTVVQRCETSPAATDAAADAARSVEFEALFQLNPSLMWVSEAKTAKLLAVNDAALRAFGTTREQALGMTLAELAAADNAGDRGEAFVQTKTGTVLELAVSERLIRCGERWGRIVVGRDLTAQGLVEKNLRQQNAKLEKQLAERTAQLEATRKELETFSFSVSHDLRAPLRSIAGFARTLSERYAANLDHEGHRLLRVVRDETRRMGQLIEDILSFSRVSRQDMDTSTVDLAELARCTFQQLTEATPGVKARLEIGPLPEARGDRSMLRQVLVNLLGNAIKFSGRHEAPLIELTGERDDTRTVYRIKDNGVGFDPRYTDKLFGVFQRLHSQSDFEGTGIGLALVQRIVNRHSGNVWGEGTLNGGASFYFSLPLRPKNAPARV